MAPAREATAPDLVDPKAGQERLLTVTTLAALSFGLNSRYGARIGGMGFPGVAD
jgi:hypothetical protein